MGILISGVALAVIGLAERSPPLVPFGAAGLLVLAGFLGILSVGTAGTVGGWLVFAGAAVHVRVPMAAGSRLAAYTPSRPPPHSADIDGAVIDVENILARWDLRPTLMTRPELGTMSETLVVETVAGRVVLRGHRQPEARLVNFELDVMETTRGAGVPVPSIIHTPSGDRLVMAYNKWWSLQESVDGEQPLRGHHTREQAQSMGAMLAQVHDALQAVNAAPTAESPLDGTQTVVDRATQLMALIEERLERGDDEEAALNWLRGQREWLANDRGAAPRELDDTQTIHGDYHDANLIFRGPAVVAVLDWERARPGSPAEECVRAIHLSFGLTARPCTAFLDGYRSHRELTAEELDTAAARYGHHRDRSLWLFEELYLDGNERLRPLLNTRPFVPFQHSWMALRKGLH